ncbi:hypothetical protein PV703_33130, partial [Streptomyces sp. ME01-24h]|nr:hypothetical protein [Streptomyces sp. ME01-24h]
RPVPPEPANPRPRRGVRMRIRLDGDGSWTTTGPVTPIEDPLADANPEELRFFADQYEGVPLIELYRRLRRAEWNADYYRGEYEAAVEREAKYPPLHVIQEVNARHQRIRDVLAAGGRINRALLTAALAESDDQWNARTQPATPAA